MTLTRLLAKAGVSRYKRTLWFKGCELKGTVLLVPDADLAASVTRLWGDQMKQVLPTLEIRYAQGLGVMKKEWFT